MFTNIVRASGVVMTPVTSHPRGPVVKERLAAQGLAVYGTTPAEFEAYLNAEVAKWDKLIRIAGVRVD